MSDDIEEICPSIDILTNIETGIPCYVQGCSKILFNSASLRMHVVKTHNVVASDEEKQLFTRRSSSSKKCVKKIFYCPIVDCSRGKSSNRPFPRLGQVKQHYLTVHADKKYICHKCSRGFGIEAACKRHEAKCGQMFYCSCGCPFTTREALLMHARRKQHKTPVSESTTSKNTKKTISTNNSTIQPVKTAVLFTNIICQPTHKKPVAVQRYCTILPKSKSHTMTDTHKIPQSTSKKDTATQTNLCISETGIQTVSNQTIFDVASCVDTHILGNINQHSSVGIQVNQTGLNSSSVSSMMDFSSQAMMPSICANMSHSSSVGTQHDGHFYVNRLNVENNPTCLSLSSQTLLSGRDLHIPDPRFLNSSETQTQNFDHVSLEDNAAQTLISILDMDPSCSADCGTQTQRMFDEILSQSDVELTESQTQTWLSTLMPSDSVISDDYSHRPATLEDLVNIETQTPLVMSDLPFDVGLINTETQTISESFDSNCWSYEPNGRQTQMTQTCAGILYSPFDSSNTSLMDTYTQTFLNDAGSLSNVETQT